MRLDDSWAAKRQPLNSLTRETIFPVDRHPLPGQHPRSLLFGRATLRHLIRRFHRYRRSTRFRESAGSCPQICSVIDPQSASNCVKRVCRDKRRRIKLRTDLSAGRHATAAFPSRFGASSRRRARRGRRQTHSWGRHAIRSIPRPLRYSVARNAAILLHIHLAPHHPTWPSSSEGKRSGPLRLPLRPRRIKRRGTLVFEGFN